MKENNRDERWNTIRVTSMVMYFLAMLLAFNTTIHSTAAGTKLLIGGATDVIYKTKNAWDFLLHGYEYDFIVTRWSFLTSLMCFLLGMTGRTIIEFDLLTKRPTTLALVLLIMMALISYSLSYINSTLFSSSNLFGMTMKVVKLEYERGMKTKHPLELVWILSGAGTLVVLVKIIFWDFALRRRGDIKDKSEKTMNNNNTRGGGGGRSIGNYFQRNNNIIGPYP